MLHQECALLLSIEDRIFRAQMNVHQCSRDVRIQAAVLNPPFTPTEVQCSDAYTAQLDTALDLWMNAVDRLAWMLRNGAISGLTYEDSLRPCYHEYMRNLLLYVKPDSNIAWVVNYWDQAVKTMEQET